MSLQAGSVLECRVSIFREIRGAVIVSLGMCNFVRMKWETGDVTRGRPAVHAHTLTFRSLLLPCADEKVM